MLRRYESESRKEYNLIVGSTTIDKALNKAANAFSVCPEAVRYFNQNMIKYCKDAFKKYIVEQNALSVMYAHRGEKYAWEQFKLFLTDEGHSYYFSIKRICNNGSVSWNINLSLLKITVAKRRIA